MSDRRDRGKPYDSFDERRMMLSWTVDNDGEEGRIELPAVFAVCDVCDGKGAHVNPNIDRHGLSREDFDHDPDFRESYFSGLYDVPCHTCDGRRVMPIIDEAHADAAALARVNDLMDDRAEYAATCAAERRAEGWGF